MFDKWANDGFEVIWVQIIHKQKKTIVANAACEFNVNRTYRKLWNRGRGFYLFWQLFWPKFILNCVLLRLLPSTIFQKYMALCLASMNFEVQQLVEQGKPQALCNHNNPAISHTIYQTTKCKKACQFISIKYERVTSATVKDKIS